MGRRYVVTFEQVAVSAPQDLVAILGASNKVAKILRCWCNSSDTTLPTSQMLAFRGRYLPATLGGGSGGTSATPKPFEVGMPAASCTALQNSTTKSTTSGTAVILLEDAAHIYNGYDRTFIEPPIVIPATAFVFELLSTVSGTVHLSGGVEFEEIG